MDELIVKSYDSSKPISLIWNNNTNQLLTGSNLPWIISNNKGELKVNPMLLSNYLKNEEYNGKKLLNYYIVKSSDGTNKYHIFVYRKGKYMRMAEEEFKGMIRIFIPQMLRNNKVVNEVYSDLISSNMFMKESLFNSNENIINFEDGIYDVTKKILLPHSPEYLSTIQIPVNYKDIQNTDYKAPIFDKYMDTLCNSDKNVIEILMECVGLSISNVYGYRTKKVLFLVGDGNTGKSQIKSLVETMLGEDNFAAVDLKTLEKQFGLSTIYGKRLIGSNDMSYQTISEIAVLKQITGGDNVDIEFKYGGHLNYKYKGFSWFNCNKLPYFSGDRGDWVYERMMPIVCNNVIPKEKRDAHLLDKMLLEKNTILKRSLEALYRLIDKDFKFEPTKEMQIAIEKHKISNNTLLSFISECCEDASNSREKTKRSAFNKCYDAWCKENSCIKGKLNKNTISEVLASEYGEYYKKSNGIFYLEKLKIQPKIMEELGVFEKNEYVY